MRAADQKPKAEIARQKDLIQAISSESKFFQIIFDEVELYVGSSDPYKESPSTKSTKENLSEIYKTSKYKSWIWIEDGDGRKLHWDSMSTFARIYPESDKKKKGAYITRATGSYLDLFFPTMPKNYDQFKAANNGWQNFQSKVKEIEKDSKGKWLSTEEVCGLANKRKWSVNEDQRKNLKIYCSKPKSKN